MQEFDEILDAEVNKQLYPFQEILKWWEKKRLIYSFVLILVAFGACFSNQTDYNFLQEFDFYFGLTFYIIAANLFYSLGWGIPFLFYYYFKIKLIAPTFNWILFLIGICISILMTYIFFMVY